MGSKELRVAVVGAERSARERRWVAFDEVQDV
jgi:hypothetical protein